MLGTDLPGGRQASDRLSTALQRGDFPSSARVPSEAEDTASQAGALHALTSEPTSASDPRVQDGSGDRHLVGLLVTHTQRDEGHPLLQG